MKKILILPILIAPIVAHATDPVGPAAVGQGKTPVIATANAPYATAGAETGDSTTVVSASYVKGAYNDAIAAINKVASKVSNVESDLVDFSDFINDDKQTKLVAIDNSDSDISSNVVGVDTFELEMLHLADEGSSVVSDYLNDSLVTASGIGAGIMAAIYGTGVKAVTTWGADNNTTVLDFVPNND